MITLLPHQQQFVDQKVRQAILAWGTRVGKTYTICFWMKEFPECNFLLVCPKRIKGQWEGHLKETDVLNATVVTKEEVKKMDTDKYTGLVVDEAHWIASPLHSNPSQLTRTIYDWVRQHEDAPVLLATATPISSSPANLHTLATFIGHRWDWKKYRNAFYDLVNRPYVPRPFWEKKKTWRKKIAPLALKVCNIVKLSDIVEVPEQRHDIVKVNLSKETKTLIDNYADESAAKEWYAKHQLAQRKEKLQKIRELASDEPKVIVVCRYTGQVAYYEKELSKDREVVVLTGKTKDQPKAIKRAHEMTEGYFIAQADTLEGFRGDTFSMLIFASMSNKVVSYEQSIGRMLHLEKERPNQYYYLLADEKDYGIYERIQEGKDFTSPTITKEKA